MHARSKKLIALSLAVTALPLTQRVALPLIQTYLEPPRNEPWYRRFAGRPGKPFALRGAR